MSRIMIAVQKGKSTPYQTEVEGTVFGAWAAHLSTTGLDYSVTLTRFGLAVPYAFDTKPGACRAAEAINALRSDWDEVSSDDIKAMAADIIAICEREKGERSFGPKVNGTVVPVEALPTASA